MVLAFDGDRVVEAKECGQCERPYLLARSFVLSEGSAYAVVFAACHRHGDGNEVWIDAILGSFGGGDSSDHVTFGCRVGSVQGQRAPAATAVDAAQPYSDQPIWGTKLTRAQALEHPRVTEFCELVDFILIADPDVNEHVYGQAS
jgi:hypothetical protein